MVYIGTVVFIYLNHKESNRMKHQTSIFTPWPILYFQMPLFIPSLQQKNCSKLLLLVPNSQETPLGKHFIFLPDSFWRELQGHNNIKPPQSALFV